MILTIKGETKEGMSSIAFRLSEYINAQLSQIKKEEK